MTIRRLIATVFVLSLSLTGCAMEAGSSSSALFGDEVTTTDYEDIYYYHCVGSGKDDTSPTEKPNHCDQTSDCEQLDECKGGKCSCDMSCNCCFLKDPDPEPLPDTLCRYVWTACPEDGGECPATITPGHLEYTWFTPECDLTEADELRNDLCMVHVDKGNKGCIYKTTSPKSNCSAPSTGGAGKYECGDKTCRDVVSRQCNPGPTGKFTYTLVGGDTCEASTVACNTDDPMGDPNPYCDVAP